MKDYSVELGSWLTRPELAVTEIMARRPEFKWLTIDIEHTTISIAQVEEMIRVIQLSGKEAFVRISENDATLIKRVLDAGANGIIVPMVNSAEDVKKALNSVFYPPRGNRGVGLARAQKYGIGFENYKEEIEPQTKVIIQIEHIDAVRNIDEIFSVAGIYGYFIGPYDLSASLGTPGDFECSEVVDALGTVRKAGIKHNVRAGYHQVEPDAAKLDKRIKEGYKIIAVSFDMLFLQRGIDAVFSDKNSVKK